MVELIRHRRESSLGVRAGHWLILIPARLRDARDLGLVVVPVEAREAVAVHLLEGFVVRRHNGLSAPRRLRLARLARGTVVVWALSTRPGPNFAAQPHALRREWDRCLGWGAAVRGRRRTAGS